MGITRRSPGGFALADQPFHVFAELQREEAAAL